MPCEDYSIQMKVERSPERHSKQGANNVIDYVCHPEATEALSFNIKLGIG